VLNSVLSYAVDKIGVESKFDDKSKEVCGRLEYKRIEREKILKNQ